MTKKIILIEGRFFMGSLGHSIVKAKGDRVYIEKGNTAKRGDVNECYF